MDPEPAGGSRWRRSALLIAAVFSSVACQAVQERIGELIVAEGYELSFERTADLIPPDGLQVTSVADRKVTMTWNPVLVGDVAGYAITRASKPEGPFTLVGQTTSRFGTLYSDEGDPVQGLGDGQTFHYRIHPYDAAARVSRSHAYVRATTEPRPDVPQGLRVFSNLPRRVVLVWDVAQRHSTTGYVIERSPTVSGPWERIGSTDDRLVTQYEDPVPGDLRVLYYRIAARNRFGGESDTSEAVRAVTKAEPLPPIGLRVREQALGRITLTWEANVEPDLAYYEVWRAQRRVDGWTDAERIGQVDGVETEFSDPTVGCGEPVRYRLRVIDADGLPSAYSQPLEVRGPDIGLEFEPPALLRWDVGRTEGWERTRVALQRSFWPDRELALVSEAGQLELTSLGGGDHRLLITPARASGRVEAWERCQLRVSIGTPALPN